MASLMISPSGTLCTSCSSNASASGSDSNKSSPAMSNVSLREFLKHNIVIEGVQARHCRHDHGHGDEDDDAKEDEWHCHVYGAHPKLNVSTVPGAVHYPYASAMNGLNGLNGLNQLSVPIPLEKWSASPRSPYSQQSHGSGLEAEMESLSDPNPSYAFFDKDNYKSEHVHGQGQGQGRGQAVTKRQKCKMTHSIHPSMAMSRKGKQGMLQRKHSPNLIDSYSAGSTLLDL